MFPSFASVFAFLSVLTYLQVLVSRSDFLRTLVTFKETFKELEQKVLVAR